MIGLATSLALAASMLVGAVMTGIGITPATAAGPWAAVGHGIYGSTTGQTGGPVVNAMARVGSKVYIGGNFATAEDPNGTTTTAEGIVAWDQTTSTYSALGSGIAGGVVNAIAVSGSDVYVAGSFSSAGGIAVKGIAKWNGTTWSSVGTSPNNGVTGGDINALAFDGGGTLWLGGSFTSAGAATGANIARWDGTSWLSTSSGSLGGVVRGLGYGGGTMYAVGDFTHLVRRWNGSSWVELGVSPGAGYIQPGVGGGGAYAVTVFGSDVYVTGSFKDLYIDPSGTTSANGFVKFDGTKWVMVNTGQGGTGLTSLAGAGRALVVDAAGQLYVAGSFNTAAGVGAQSIAMFDPVTTTWSGLGGGIDVGAGYVKALVVDGVRLYAGGDFNGAFGVPMTQRLATWLSDPLFGVSSVSWGTHPAGPTGPTGGGGTLTLTGTGYGTTGAPLLASVKVGGTTCAPVAVISATSATCTLPAGTAGLVDVEVTNTAAESYTLPNGFTYLSAPTIGSISPAAGPTSGGGTLTLTGTGFVPGMAVTIAGNACTSVSVASVGATTATCTIPAGTVGAKDVVVTTNGGATTSTGAYSYVAAPTVGTISPTSGPLGGGTTITITGTGFVAPVSVTVDSNACTSVTVSSATSLTCVTPAGIQGAKDVVVTAAGGSGTKTNGFSYLPLPTITSVSPTSLSTSPTGTLTINGTNFVNGSTTVTVGGTSCTPVTFVSATQVTCPNPGHAAGLVDVVLGNGWGSTTAANAVTFVAPPVIGTISPGTGTTGGGTTITLSGSGFSAPATVTVDSNACTSVTVVSATELTCVTPAGSVGAKDVVVTTPGGSDTKAGGFTYALLPSITTVSPTSITTAPTGTITVNGTNFVNGSTTVTVGSTSCTPVTFVSATQVTCPNPGHAAGLVDVGVATGAGSDSKTNALRFVTAPTVTNVSPSPVSTTAGDTLTITGTGFVSGQTDIDLGGTSCTPVTFVSATQVTCPSPGGSPGTVTVTAKVYDVPGTTTGSLTFVTPPNAPTNAVATAGAGSALVTWDPPTTVPPTPTDYLVTAWTGGSATAQTCTVSATANPLQCTVPGLTPGTTYTFDVVAQINGISGPAVTSNPVVPTAPPTPSGGGGGSGGSGPTPSAKAKVPSAPRNVTAAATPGPGQATVTWSAPASDGGSAITRYVVTAAPGGASCIVTTTSCVIAGLAPGTSYVFTVAAVNAIGAGPGATSNAVVPTGAGDRLAADPNGTRNAGTGSTGATGDGGKATRPVALQPGRSQLLVDGAPTKVTVIPNRKAIAQATGLSITGPGFTMTLVGRGDASDPLGLTPKQALVLESEQVAGRVGRMLTLAPAKVQPFAESTGSGFMANSEVRFYLLADVYLGSLPTDATGAYRGRLPIPAGIEPGAYVLQANGFAPTGEVRSLSLGVQVEASAAATATAQATVYFAAMSPSIDAAGKAALDRLVARTRRDGVRTVVVGYVQPTAHTTANDLQLSRQRANAVAAYLQAKGLTGAYVVRGDGRAKESGAVARRVNVTVTYRK